MQAHRYGVQVDTTKASNEMWALMLEELVRHETSDADCREFHRYFELSWQPQVFHWHLERTEAHFNDHIRLIQADPEYLRLFISPLLAGIRYMSHRLPFYPYSLERITLIGGISILPERVMQLFHLFVIFRATGGALSPDIFSQIIEFGGGSGSNAALLREVGFTGIHIVYDFRPMLLMQQYFLRLSGWPSYMSDGLTREDLQGRKTLLVSQWEDMDGLLSDPRANDWTLFIATWSISEVPVEEREPYFYRLLSYGVDALLVVFQINFFGIDNSKWFNDIYINSYLRGHGYSYLWFTVEDGATNYIIAIKSDLEPHVRLRCDPSFGCSEQTLVLCSGCVDFEKHCSTGDCSAS